MNVHDIFPSRWLSGHDLNGKPVTVTIKAVTMEEMYSPRGEETKPVVWFEKASKGLILNKTNAMAIASLRAPVEETRLVDGRELGMVRGRLENGKEAVLYPGTLPEDPSRLLVPARDGAERWLDEDYSVMLFAPAPGTLKPGEGPPHIRLDRAAEFLFGDRLR